MTSERRGRLRDEEEDCRPRIVGGWGEARPPIGVSMRLQPSGVALTCGGQGGVQNVKRVRRSATALTEKKGCDGRETVVHRTTCERLRVYQVKA